MTHLLLIAVSLVAVEPGQTSDALMESITKETLRRNRDGFGTTWFHPRACVVPSDEGRSAVLMTLQAIGGSDYFGPVHWSESHDLGKTWSKPQPILDRGVWPTLTVMPNGVVVCTAGRPGIWLVFSTDDGRTWGGEFCIYEENTSSIYNNVLTVAPDTILLIYDRRPPNSQADSDREIAGTFITVKKK